MANVIISDFGATTDVQTTDIVPFQRGLISGSESYGYYTVQQLANFIMDMAGGNTYIVEPPTAPPVTGPSLDFSKASNSQYIAL